MSDCLLAEVEGGVVVEGGRQQQHRLHVGLLHHSARGIVFKVKVKVKVKESYKIRI